MSTPIIAHRKPTVKPRTVIDADGIIWFRTKVTTFDRANRFAHCIRANAARFESAIVVQSRLANPPDNFLVKFLAANPLRQVALAQGEEQKRADRAVNGKFVFYPDPDNSSLVFCYSLESEKVYELRRREGAFVSCNCPDSSKGIARRLLIPCKHRLRAAEEFAPATRPVESAEDRRARILREREEDYGD